MSTPTFFILTPTHNRARRLESAIESVLDQSYEGWEMFVLDDGSGDDTPEVLARHSSHPRIHSWRFDTNRGVNPARNFLLERILERDEPGFVVILDDDDRLEPDALARFAEAARADPSALWMIGNCHLRDGRLVSRIRGRYRPLCYVRDHKLGNVLSGDVAHVFHTSLIGETRFIDDFANAEEWWFYAGLARRTRMLPLDFHAKTVEYLEGGLSLSKPNRDERAAILELRLERFEPFLTRSQRAAYEARLGRHLHADGEREAGWRALGRAWRRWPFEHRIYVCALQMALGPIWQRLTGRGSSVAERSG